MSVVTPPPPRSAREHVDPELLIEEARERQRHRRRRSLAAAMVVLVAAALAAGIDRWVARGGASNAAALPNGVFVNRSAFAGHGLLAFLSRGRLFVLDGRTQKVTAVTRAGAQATDPRFSPNRRWLAYTVGTGRLGIAHADGSSAHLFAGDGGAAWLPNGELLARNGIFRLAGDGRLVRVSAAPAGLSAWSPAGDRFAFVSRSIIHGKGGAFHGVERLQIADSLTGRRTTWRSAPFSFTPKLGFQGDAINGVEVLPRREGVLFWLDPDQSASLAADGMAVYELRAPLAKPRRLAVTVGADVSVGSNGKLAIGAGGDRYAWLTKDVVTCGAGRCTRIPATPGRLTIDPAWSPDGKTLAYVEAAPGAASNFFQATITRWYATHTLWLLQAGATHATQVAGTTGAAVPTWSNDGRSLLYVAGDALWLLPTRTATPQKIAGPLFPPGAWPSYYGQIDWNGEFTWASP